MEGHLTVAERKTRRPMGRPSGSWMDPVVVIGRELPVEERASPAQLYLA